MDGELSDLLRSAVETGDWTAFAARLSPDAVLRTSSERGRLRIDGAKAVVDHLSNPGPGQISAWEAQEWPNGAALTFEWVGAGSTDRRRWYVRRDDHGAVVEIWSAAAAASDPARGPLGPPRALLDRIGAVAVEPLAHGGNSGASLLRATRAEGTGFVLKRVTAGADWLARATRDDGRTVRLYEAGAFGVMPSSIEPGIVDVARDGGVAWVAMRDLGGQLLDPDARIARSQSRRVLEAAAAMHAAFRGDVPDGAATLSARLGMCSPRVAAAERARSDLLPKQFEHGWEAFAEIVAGDVADPVLGLATDPAPLAEALVRAYGGATLVHGDLRDDNLGFDGDRVVLIDWDLATAGTPTVDFAWYLAQDAWRIDATHDQLEADFREAEGGGAVEAEVELGMLSGLVQYGWLIAHSARVHPNPDETAWAGEELAWWVPRVRSALERLGGSPA